jgi:ZIP family zinc transporter
MTGNIGMALILTAAAGLATTLGSLLGLVVAKPGPKFMGFTLGFSAGVMILISFVELLPSSIDSIGYLHAFAGLFIGMAGIFLLDLLVPHEYIGQDDYPGGGPSDRLKRTGLLLAFGIGIHNFPEGMATFAGSLKNVSLGAAIAVAIAIHNIPEGLAVSAPVLAATGSRRKAFMWSFLSGISEPVGAAAAALVLFPFLTPALLGWILAGVAGLMIVIALDELVPAAKAFGATHVPIIGVMAGMGIMALSLWLIKIR